MKLKNRSTVLLVVLALAGSALAGRAAAEDPSKDKPDSKTDSKHDDKADKDQDKLLALLPADAVTQHALQLGAQHLAYTATAGTLTLRDDKGDRSAAVFYVAYTLQGPASAGRPVSFFFNGGPGAATAYIHLGAAGPMTLDFPVGNEADGAGAKLRENPDSWLPFTDMVFIDAVGTGWSRPAKPDEAQKEFWGVKQDAVAFAKSIALWLGRNGRGNSPTYLVGESYGGIRSVKVARELQSQQGVILDGIVMVSPAIDMDFVEGSTDNPLVDALRLPSLVASDLERQHKFSPQAVEDAYKFATGDYLQTIVGAPPAGDAAKSFYGKIADMTGVPEPVVAQQRGRLDPQSHDVRSHDGRIFSLYEGSLTIADPFPAGEEHEVDPVLYGYTRAYGSAFTAYAADTLGFKTELTYKLLAEDVNEKWDFRSDEHHTAEATDDLRRLLALDPSLKLFIAGGYFDLVCPIETNRWIVDHLPVGRDRVILKDYAGGHMIYTRPASRAALRADVGAFYASTTH